MSTDCSSYPGEQVVEIIVSRVGAVPRNEEVDVLAIVDKFCGKVDRHKKRGVAVFCSMSDVPVLSNVGVSGSDVVHRVHDCDAACHLRIERSVRVVKPVSQAEVGEVGRIAIFIAENFVLG